MKIITTVCPVCRRHVKRQRAQPIISRHTDQAGSICPMSGNPLTSNQEA